MEYVTRVNIQSKSTIAKKFYNDYKLYFGGEQLMSRIENYITENEALTRIEDLRSEGVADKDITVLSQQPIDKNFFDSNEINFRDSEGSAWDKFVSFFSADEPEEKVLNDLGLSESEQVEYRNSLNAGEVLVYIATPAENNDSSMNYGEKRDFDNTNTTAVGTAGGSVINNDARDQFDNDSIIDDEDLPNNERPSFNNEPPLDGRAVDTDNGLTEEERIKLREERVSVDKENVQTGEVKIGKHVETDTQEFDIPVEREEVVVERRQVDDVPKEGAFSNTDDVDEVRIPLNEERVNVTKDNVVNEEIVIKKEKHEDVEHISEEVKREEVDVEEDDYRK